LNGLGVGVYLRTMANELFRSADLLIRRVDGHGSPCCVVTFDSFTDLRTLDRPGFAEDFLRMRGIDAIHVIPRDNDWYQYPEMTHAMAAVRAVSQTYGRVVTYGSSMGAYAAIRLAGLAGAHAVFALSPQFSIDRTLVPWERRWIQSSASFRNVWERSLPLPDIAEAYVFFDPDSLDRRHIAPLARRFGFTAVHVGGGGHPVTGYLAEIGLLQEAVIEVCQGPLNLAGFAEALRERRKLSAQYHLMLATRTSRYRPGRRAELAREAARLAPDSPMILSRVGVLLSQARRFTESFAMHRRTLTLAPGHPNMLYNQSISLESVGDLEAALQAMEEASRSSGGAAIYDARLHDLRKAVARRASAGPLARTFGRIVRQLGRLRSHSTGVPT
jgi:hypothetical protein